ncbi:MAG: DUF177 domain-containing protein [Bdellovibrio sp.]|nr:DUF177 domain-containing protein [Bdellovibrio sp.]
MKIRLNEIPEEGREYILNRKTAELNLALEDLIKNLPYDVKIYIKPINTKDFEMTGTIRATTSEDCSRCGIDFDYSIDKKIHEILIPFMEDDRTSQYARSSTPISEESSAMSVINYKSSQIDLGDYVHEAIALDIPFNPAPSCTKSGECTLCHKNFGNQPFIYDEKMGEEAKPNPFKALKDLKLN